MRVLSSRSCEDRWKLTFAQRNLQGGQRRDHSAVFLLLFGLLVQSVTPSFLARRSAAELSVQELPAPSLLECPFVRHNYRCVPLLLNNSTSDAIDAEEGSTEFGTSFERSDFSRRCGGDEAPLLTPNAKILFAGSSHIREIAQALICANAASLVEIKVQGGDRFQECKWSKDYKETASCSARDVLDGPCLLEPWPLNTAGSDSEYDGRPEWTNFKDDLSSYRFSNGAFVYVACNHAIITTTEGVGKPGSGDAAESRLRGFDQLAAVFGFAPSSLTGVVVHPGHNFRFGAGYFRGMSVPDSENGSGAVPPCCRVPAVARTPVATGLVTADSGDDEVLQYPHPDGVQICKALKLPENENLCLINVVAFLGDIADAGFKGAAVVLDRTWYGSPGDAAAAMLGSRDCLDRGTSGGRGVGNRTFSFEVGFLDLSLVMGGRSCSAPTCSQDIGDTGHQCLWLEEARLAGHPFDAARILLRMLSGQKLPYGCPSQ
ncbi:unnamed protein product [Phaeothamnion confervicola]